MIWVRNPAMGGESKSWLDRHTVYAAAILALGALAYWWMFYHAGYSSGAYQERAHIEREHYAADASKRLGESCDGLTGADLRKCAYDIIKTERESGRAESDLAAQWQASDWAMWAAIVAGAQLLATITGLILLKGTLDATWRAVEDTGEATDAMRKANEIARKMLELEHRPLMVFDRCEFRSFSPDVDLARIYWINRGKLPAIVSVAQVWKTMGNAFTSDEAIRAIMEAEPSVRRNPDETIMGGQTYVVGEFAMHREFFIKGHVFAPGHIPRGFPFGLDKNPWFLLVAELRYSAAFSGERQYVTKFVLTVEPLWDGENLTGEYEVRAMQGKTQLT